MSAGSLARRHRSPGAEWLQEGLKGLAIIEPAKTGSQQDEPTEQIGLTTNYAAAEEREQRKESGEQANRKGAHRDRKDARRQFYNTLYTLYTLYTNNIYFYHYFECV